MRLDLKAIWDVAFPRALPPEKPKPCKTRARTFEEVKERDLAASKEMTEAGIYARQQSDPVAAMVDGLFEE